MRNYGFNGARRLCRFLFDIEVHMDDENEYKDLKEFFSYIYQFYGIEAIGTTN